MIPSALLTRPSTRARLSKIRCCTRGWTDLGSVVKISSMNTSIPDLPTILSPVVLAFVFSIVVDRSMVMGADVPPSPPCSREGLGKVAVATVRFSFTSTRASSMIVFAFAVASSKALPTVNGIFASIVRYKTAIPSLKIFNEEFSEITKKKLNTINQKKIIFSKCIELKNINFNFEDNSFELSNINLKIKKGEFIGLCGPTGSGKTTLVDLISSVYEPKTGSLLVDDILINEKNADNFKFKISYVSQNFFLGDMTIAELISFGSDQKQNLEEIRKVAKISEIDQFIENLPNKYNTKFGDAGLKLSGGQQQRIAIARALFKKPEILVLDETTGSVDLVTEQKIINNLQNIKKDITIILIAHRVGSLKNCSNIFLMNQGKLSMSGRYEEIIKKSDLFKSLI